MQIAVNSVVAGIGYVPGDVDFKAVGTAVVGIRQHFMPKAGQSRKNGADNHTSPRKPGGTLVALTAHLLRNSKDFASWKNRKDLARSIPAGSLQLPTSWRSRFWLRTKVVEGEESVVIPV